MSEAEKPERALAGKREMRKARALVSLNVSTFWLEEQILFIVCINNEVSGCAGSVLALVLKFYP